MPVISLDAVSVTSSDLHKSAAFYRLLGFAFGEFGPDQDHIEARATPDGVRLMIDSKSLIASLTGVEPKPATHSAFAMLCQSPAEVDGIAAAVAASGYDIVNEPWDAFWGQRYAIVRDPDGYMVDLFAPLG